MCYRKLDVRAKYAPKVVMKKFTQPTEAELDAVIAEQRKTLPAWWGYETDNPD